MAEPFTLPVLPLDQPYATWTVARPAPDLPPVKRVETRTKPWRYRGWLGIHATAAPVSGAVSVRGGRAIAAALGRPLVRSHAKGAIIGLVYLTGCEEMTEALIRAQSPLELAMGIWTPGRYALTFAHQVELGEPIPFKAKQGINRWAPPSPIIDLLGELEAQRQMDAALDHEERAAGGGATAGDSSGASTTCAMVQRFIPSQRKELGNVHAFPAARQQVR